MKQHDEDMDEAQAAALGQKADKAPEFDWDLLAKHCGVRSNQARTVIDLTVGGATVPFLARYRKEATGGLDEVWIRLIIDEHEKQAALQKRRLAIKEVLRERGVLSADLEASLDHAPTMAALEDLYAPYKQKRKTKAELARQKGLGPAAESAWKTGEKEIEKTCAALLAANPDLGDIQTVKEGIIDILAEEISHKDGLRASLGKFCHDRGGLGAKPKVKGEDWEKSPYRQYGEFKDGLKRLKPHQWLALRRGEKEGHLALSWDLDRDGASDFLGDQVRAPNSLVLKGREAALDRHLLPAVQREQERGLDEAAEKAALDTFQQNLRPVLLQAPLKGRRVLAIDPGLRTGCKTVALDGNGNLLGYFTFNTNRQGEAETEIAKGIKKYDSQLVVIGNGTGTEAVQDAVSAVIGQFPDVTWTIVPEDGASVYSASPVAREEFPDLDVSVRGAVSLGRRILDPLSELVKIDPKSLGVGMYQHDVDQGRLEATLQGVVEGVVNQVGVQGPSASASILRHVSGLGPSLAKKIVDYRSAGNPFKQRKDLLKVPGLGPKTYEQCAGFIKFPESKEPLDNTWVHPESYPLARELKDWAAKTEALPPAVRKDLKARFAVGDQSIDEVLEELRRPNRTPRDASPLPPMYSKRLRFEDLSPGQIVPGQIKNLVDFGAFVDLGIKESGLVHISELADRFVRHPSEVVQVGQTMDFRIKEIDQIRRRIALSRKGLQ